jgi:DNA-directed RNA polymerase subunit RPC12/RpoP
MSVAVIDRPLRSFSSRSPKNPLKARLSGRDSPLILVGLREYLGVDRNSQSRFFVTRRCTMGPTKVIVKDNGLYDAVTGKLIKEGLTTPQAVQEYAARHYVVLPEVDNAGRPWEFDGRLVYCLRGARYESLEDRQLPLARCPDCGGMGVRVEEDVVESDCIRCTRCGHEFDARLEMMES